MYHVSESLSRGTVTLTFPPYLTFAHLVLQNYVADYINVPCFGKSVKWKCSEPVRYMNGLHDQKSLHVLMSGTCYNGQVYKGDYPPKRRACNAIPQLKRCEQNTAFPIR